MKMIKMKIKMTKYWGCQKIKKKMKIKKKREKKENEDEKENDKKLIA